MLNLQSKIVTVIGLGYSGYSAAKLLKDLKAEVHISDNHQDDSIKNRAHRLNKLGIKNIELGKHTRKIIEGSSFLVVSPGVKKDNELIQEAHRQKIPIISEIELGYLNCQAPIIAITGTNGKTTTCTLVYEILKKANKKVILCGNIGRPFCEVAKKMKPDNIVVLEVSSFQLLYINKFKPAISVVLNVEPDHLDYHDNLKEYFEAKSKIYKNQTEDDFCILRREDYRNVFSEHKNTANLILVSTNSQADWYIDNGGFIINKRNERRRYIHTSEFSTRGAKTIENILFSLVLSNIYKIPRDIAIDVINNFKGLEYRMEEVGIYKGVTYINDSKATNVAACRCAVESIEKPIILIAGGHYKGADISKVNFEFLKKTKEIILFGESKHILSESLKKISPTTEVSDLYEAVHLSKLRAKAGDYVLFSPMCASFDMFNNYKHRGRIFKQEVKKVNRR